MTNLRFNDLLQMPHHELLALYRAALAALAVSNIGDELAKKLHLLLHNIERVLAWRNACACAPSP